MKILFFIPSLRAGGAERVASILCNHWVSLNHNIIVVTYDNAEHDFYKLNSDILRFSINDHELHGNIIKKIYITFRRIFKLRSIIKQQNPNIIVSFMHMPNVIAILSSLGTNTRVVVSERTYPQYYNHNNLFDIIRKRIYKFADVLVVQTNAVAEWGATFLHKDKIKVIPNPINEQIQTLGGEPRENIVIAVGRLTPEKGFDMLINAYAKCKSVFPEWRLLIVGDGPEKSSLQQQIDSLGLHEKVILVGQTQNTQDYYSTASIFVLSSRVEGFPNVLLEAMAHGVAVISFDCNSGPADLIANNVNGLLVQANDIRQLAAAMQRLMQNSELRNILANAALQVREDYKLEHISDRWFEVFE